MSHSALEKYVGWTVGCTIYNYMAENLNGEIIEYFFTNEIQDQDLCDDGYYSKRDYKNCKHKFRNPTFIRSWEEKKDREELIEELGHLISDHVILDYDVYCSDDVDDFELDVYSAGLSDSLTPEVVQQWIDADGTDSDLKEWLGLLPRRVSISHNIVFEDHKGDTYEAPVELEMYIILDPDSMKFKVESID